MKKILLFCVGILVGCGSSADEQAAKFLQRAGFQLAASWPLTVFAHVEPAPLDLLTWVLPL